MTTTHSIHPSIGVARLGNSPTEVMFAPQTALGLPTEIVEGIERPVNTFRDGEGRIKREAARFRVYKTENGNSTALEVGDDGLADIEWTVWLANKKAQWFKFQGLNGDMPGHRRHRNNHVQGPERSRLIIDPGPRQVSRHVPTARFTASEAPPGHQATFPSSSLRPSAIKTLGELHAELDGTLNVLAGFGASGTTDSPPQITHFANNNNWFDDVADGPVTATLVFQDGRRIPVDDGAWVICAPPAFAPEIGNVVTLYDVMFDLAVRELNLRPEIFSNGNFNSNYRVDFEKELRPLFRRIETLEGAERLMTSGAHFLNWTGLQDASNESAFYRGRILDVVRPPQTPEGTHTSGGRRLMPYALGDGDKEFLTPTETQYFMLSQWAAGRFDVGAPLATGPSALDQAVLDNCVGGAFFPGIETTWIVRDKRIYASPFRIKHRSDLQDGLHLTDDLDLGLEPGDLTKRMAVPWQADFNECHREPQGGLRDVAWWPAQRPLSVLDGNLQRVEWSRGIPAGTSGDIDMVHKWKHLGFLRSTQVGQRELCIETERNDAELSGNVS